MEVVTASQAGYIGGRMSCLFEWIGASTLPPIGEDVLNGCIMQELYWLLPTYHAFHVLVFGNGSIE